MDYTIYLEFQKEHRIIKKKFEDDIKIKELFLDTFNDDKYFSSNIDNLDNLDKLYFINEKTQEKVIIPNANILSIKQLVASTQMTATMRPIYEIPAPVVYRIYYDDGHHCCEK